jgi:hypothetical protein
MLPRLIRASIKLEKYKEKLKDSPYYMAARVLDPECRTTFMKNKETTLITIEGERQLWLVRQLWKKFRKERPECVAPSYDTQKGRDDILDENLSSFAKIQRQMKVEATGLGQKDELEAYIEESPVLLQDRTTAIDWWCQKVQRIKYPNLSLLAIEVLSIPAMSDKPECVFSGCRRRVPWDRTKTSVKTLESVECMRDWGRADILKNPI